MKIVIEVEDDTGLPEDESHKLLESVLPYLRLAVSNLGFVTKYIGIE